MVSVDGMEPTDYILNSCPAASDIPSPVKSFDYFR